MRIPFLFTISHLYLFFHSTTPFLPLTQFSLCNPKKNTSYYPHICLFCVCIFPLLTSSSSQTVSNLATNLKFLQINDRVVKHVLSLFISKTFITLLPHFHFLLLPLDFLFFIPFRPSAFAVLSLYNDCKSSLVLMRARTVKCLGKFKTHQGFF